MFKCKVCLEKDKRIEDLKEQITNLRLTINPPPRVNHYELEETAVLNGGGQQLVDEETYRKESEEAESLSREADMIMMGTYGESLEIPVEG